MTMLSDFRLTDFETIASAASTSSAVGSRAKTLVSPAAALALMGSDQGFGGRSSVSLANYDRNTRSWRTSQRSLLEEWTPFVETWPTAGMTRSGLLFRRAPWVHHTCDGECSSWPTPTASMDGRGFGIPLHSKAGRYKQSTISRVHALVGEHGWKIHPHFTEALMGFPIGWTEIEPSATPSPLRSLK